MLNSIADFINRHQLLLSNKLYLVALSGGADSVALLLVLKELGYNIEAVHCNFLLRGEESYYDEHFCESLCLREKIKFHHVHFDTNTYAKLHKVSIEMAARELRYRYFEQLRIDIGAVGICVAHHLDDQVETVLMNIIRGTGLKGLTGMSPRNGYVIRPLLETSKSEIVHWLSQRKQSYVTDSSNLVDNVVRNKIRLKVIPLLKDINPCVTDNISKMVRRMVEVERIVSSVVVPFKEIDIDELLKEPSPSYTLYLSLKDYGFNSTQIDQIAFSLNKGLTGKIWYTDTHQLLFNRRRVIVEPLSKDRKPIILPETGNYVFNSDTTFKLELITNLNSYQIERLKNIANLDADKVSFPLIIRQVHEGDRFCPFGMKGSKLLSDYMTDLKMSLFEKRRQLVVEDATGTIIWVVNKRPSELCRISNKTNKILRIEVMS